jgi:L-asparaginase II
MFQPFRQFPGLAHCRSRNLSLQQPAHALLAKPMQPNPALVEVYRGTAVESRHRGAFAVVGKEGRLIAAAGDIETPVFPRSAIKAFQALPLVESGGADALSLSDEEIALLCSSHSGEDAHVRVARSILAKAGMSEENLECGAHAPQNHDAMRALIKAGLEPGQIHNNCSGKHAGMLALASRLAVDPKNYVGLHHPVQQAMARVLDDLCAVETISLPVGIDGCSVPTWAIPLRNLALGFQRFVSGETLNVQRRAAARRILAAVRAQPYMIAGTNRFCTKLMEAVPRVFVKTGAEGVFCAGVPHARIGIALKCEDGAHRASEAAIAAVLASLDCWEPEERTALDALTEATLRNWRKLVVGKVKALPVSREIRGSTR